MVVDPYSFGCKSVGQPRWSYSGTRRHTSTDPCGSKVISAVCQLVILSSPNRIRDFDKDHFVSKAM